MAKTKLKSSQHDKSIAQSAIVVCAALTTAALAAIPLAIVWTLVNLHESLENGGTLGGFGEAARPPESGGESLFIFTSIVFVFLVGIAGWLGAKIAKRVLRTRIS